MIELIVPHWPAHERVRAVSTTRLGGTSLPPFDSLNLGQHTCDTAHALGANLCFLDEAALLHARPQWLKQVHGTRAVDLDDDRLGGEIEADAAIARHGNRVCAIQTADCLPVLFAASDGSCVGAAHAGWRGLAGGVLEQTVAALRTPPAELHAWLGPAIGPTAYEVGDEVRAAFVAHDSQASGAFERNATMRWMCDLFSLARQRLAAAGVTQVFGGGVCTYSNPRRFYSFRRDGRTGRMASLIWLT
jgi:polyphenol oxidase